MPERRDLILILGADHSAGDLGENYRVTQRLSPRVVIVEPSGDTTKEKLQTMKGVDAVLEPGESLAGDVRSTLTDTEALFVDAYAQRSRHKKRLGEGLDWDAEGFLPPDPPTKR
jgi:hypothetical protein